MSEHRFEVVAVLGAGTMGRGIAQVAAQGGYATRLYDVDGKVLELARARIERNLGKGVELGKVAASDAEGALGRLATHTALAEKTTGPIALPVS